MDLPVSDSCISVSAVCTYSSDSKIHISSLADRLDVAGLLQDSAADAVRWSITFWAGFSGICIYTYIQHHGLISGAYFPPSEFASWISDLGIFFW